MSRDLRNYEPVRKLETPSRISIKRRKRKEYAGKQDYVHDFRAGVLPTVIMGGIVVQIAKKGGSCCIRNRACRIWIHWALQTLPEGVSYGDRVYFVGHLKSYNCGGAYNIVNACLIRETPRALLTTLFDTYPEAVKQPKKEVRI